MNVRTINVHGTASGDAEYKVTVDNWPVAHTDSDWVDPFHPDLGQVLYSFQTPTTLCGYVSVRIKVIAGTLKLTRSRAVYPAKIINSKQETFYGKYYFFQPILDPKYLVRINGQLFTPDPIDQDLTGEFEHQIQAGDVLEYYHLMRNGPGYWVITTSTDQPYTQIDGEDPHIIACDEDHRDRLEIIKQHLLDSINTSATPGSSDVGPNRRLT